VAQLLIVEDEPSTRELMEELFTCAGHQPHAVAGMADAIAVLEDTEFDMVVLDLALQDGDGAELVRLLRAQGMETPVLACSGLPPDDGLIASVLEQGADGFIQKPFSCRELLARVRAVLRRTTVQRRPLVALV
jgi:DNA-binding response OmpR family regulator